MSIVAERCLTAGGASDLYCQDVSLTYVDGTKRVTYALKDISIQLAAGRFYGIMGPSGSGKSSLLYVLSGLKRASAGSAGFGSVRYGDLRDADIARLRRRSFGFVFQQPFLLSYLTVVENVAIAAPRQGREATAAAMHFLSEMGIAEMGNKYPSELSGGERQRVSVSRALMNDPDVVFADEPTAALDRRNGHRVIDALAQWRGRGTVVVVTHDAEMVSGADEVFSLRDGRREALD